MRIGVCIIIDASEAETKELQEFTGRSALWQIGFDLWTKAPIAGFGPNAFHVAVNGASFSTGSFAHSWELTALANLPAGGFHNIWIQTLAANGLCGLAGLMISYYFLLKYAIGAVCNEGSVLCALSLVLYVHGFSEASVFFGEANSTLDFIAVILVSWQLGLAVPAANKRPVPNPRLGYERRGAESCIP